jgi:tRNA (mo5U34)-methyltransferase
MDREDLLEGIQRLAPWFHAIELAPGVFTKTESVSGEPADHPRPTWEIIKDTIPSDLSGKSVLDVGCNAGFYAVEAKRRNAERVLGVDAMRREIMQADFVRRALDLDIEFRPLSVYDLSAESVGRFDLTLALGLIYHLKHLVLGIERLAEVTKGTLVVETALLPENVHSSKHFFKRHAEYVVGDLKRPLHPIGWVENPPESAEAIYNWFLPSLEATVALFKTVGFEAVDVFDVRGDRAVVVCRQPEAALTTGATTELAANLRLVNGPTTCRPGEDLTYRIAAGNRGSATWRARGEGGSYDGAMRLGAHLASSEGADVPVWDYARADLDADVGPGEETSIVLTARAPERPGTYQVEFDMVAEGVAWFEDRGSAVISSDLRVETA